MTAFSELPTASRSTPTTRSEVTELVRDCFESSTAIYPLAGETSLSFGLAGKTPGLGLSMSGLRQVVDFPARDMTITVEAGLTIGELYATTSAEGLAFPVDVPFSDKATLGGVVATNWNGPRRYGYGTVRDYVIGIAAVDGTGKEFKGGGRVVKNVAGYDFCKLLTGSLGTLGVITEVTLKLKPIAESRAWFVLELSSLATAEETLTDLVNFPAIPASICLSVESGKIVLAIGVEGSRIDVDWSLAELAKRIELGKIERDGYDRRVSDLAHFPADDKSPLVVRAAVVPSGVIPFIESVLAIDPQSKILAHAGSGVVYVKFNEFPTGGLSKALVGDLHGVAQRHHGNIVILSNPSGAEMTHQAVFGGEANWKVMQEVKRQFDPKNILNPGRLFST
jgi:glycolate oxidase FAD binding subunit